MKHEKVRDLIMDFREFIKERKIKIKVKYEIQIKAEIIRRRYN